MFKPTVLGKEFVFLPNKYFKDHMINKPNLPGAPYKLIHIQ